MADSYEILDLFAGPGGLGEGFSVAGLEGKPRMRIRLSVEKEAIESETLRLRAFLRSFEGELPREYHDWLNGRRDEPDWSSLYSARWAEAGREARRLELGTEGVFEEIAPIIDRSREATAGRTILIGGPPCQAYSLVGRARNRGKSDYVPSADKRHFLYREYVRILDRLRPAVFVMENVKGLLSSRIEGDEIWRRVVDDLRSAGDGYRLLPLSAPRNGSEPDRNDFIVRAEEQGLPQARHRVFIVGLRSDLRAPPDGDPLLPPRPDLGMTVDDAIADLPKLRSGLSTGDHDASWKQAVHREGMRILDLKDVPGDVAGVVLRSIGTAGLGGLARNACAFTQANRRLHPELRRFIVDPRLRRIVHHETRSHRADDLGRYLFVAAFGKARGVSPKLSDFPHALLPAHDNREAGVFEDRFRVQLADRPSSTVTSHISKDGHYFIHPDPSQVRSLTVREAARLQTFPDNYVFRGGRTKQYHQVGNAVPPYLAYRIARAVRGLLFTM